MLRTALNLSHSALIEDWNTTHPVWVFFLNTTCTHFLIKDTEIYRQLTLVIVCKYLQNCPCSSWGSLSLPQRQHNQTFKWRVWTDCRSVCYLVRCCPWGRSVVFGIQTSEGEAKYCFCNVIGCTGMAGPWSSSTCPISRVAATTWRRRTWFLAVKQCVSKQLCPLSYCISNKNHQGIFVLF